MTIIHTLNTEVQSTIHREPMTMPKGRTTMMTVTDIRHPPNIEMIGTTIDADRASACSLPVVRYTSKLRNLVHPIASTPMSMRSVPGASLCTDTIMSAPLNRHRPRGIGADRFTMRNLHHLDTEADWSGLALRLLHIDTEAVKPLKVTHPLRIGVGYDSMSNALLHRHRHSREAGGTLRIQPSLKPERLWKLFK